MAAPNLKNPTTITGKTAVYACTTTLAEALSNGGSGKVLRVATIRASNVSVSGAVTIDLTLYRGSTHTYQIKGFSIISASSLILSDRNEVIYLEEGDALYAKANANSSVELTISYEEIS